MNQKGTLEILTKEVSLALAPLRSAVSDLGTFQAFLRNLGWNVNNLPSEYSDLFANINEIITEAEELSNDPSLENIADLLQKVADLYQDLKALNVAPGGVDPGPFLSEFFEAIFKLLIYDYVSVRIPKVYSLLELTGVVTRDYVEDTASRSSFVEYNFHPDRVGEFIQNPVSFFSNIYQWGTENFEFRLIFDRIFEWLYGLGLNPIYSRDSEVLASKYSINNYNVPGGLTRIEAKLLSFYIGQEIYSIGFSINYFPGDYSLALPGILIEPIIPNEVTASIELGENLSLELNAFTSLFENFALIISPSGVNLRFPFQSALSAPTSGVGGTLIYEAENPTVLLGRPDSSRVEFKGAELGIGVSGSNFQDFEVIFDATLKQFKIVIKAGDGDGFIKKIFGDQEQVFESDFGVRWSNLTGFNFKGGGGGLVVGLVEHIEIGPLSIDQLTLAIRSLTGGTSGFSALVSANIGLELGPFVGVVEDLGVNLKVKFEEGNAGPFDIGVGFKPPTGVGFSIDANAFKGGGFLSFDFDEERYVGALELTVKDKISLKIIGILTTKLPGNDDGYSLLLLITAEFQPINLGFGFTLNGVGGLIALNRTMNLNFLRDGVKSNTLDNILFPTDPIANINQIISDLEGAFPVQEGRYAFGPMAIIGWGTPTLISLEVGLMIEVPNPVRIAILGVVKAILPTEEKSLLKLQVNFLGTLDFEAKFITFDASIFDSKLLSFTLEGDMAFRLKWGENSNFLFSIGGFHPAYTPPPLQLPSMKRLTINLLGGDNPRLTLTAYFALTSNTVQFGSAVDFYYKITNKWSVVGYLGFDILIQFNPFYLNASIAASLALMKNGNSVASIYLGGSVSGPAPWHVQGKAELEICGITLKANFDKTFGQPETTTLPDVSVLPKLEEALGNRANWQASLPQTSNLLVTIREMDTTPGNVIAHPFGTLGVSQKVVPLDMTINKFGTQRPADYKKFELDIADSNGVNFAEEVLKDYFAPAEYLQLSDSAKLTRKSFEEFNSGISIKGNNEIKSSYLMDRELMYEQVVMDSRSHQSLKELVSEKPVAFRAFTKNGSAAKSKLGSKARPVSENAPAKVSVKQEGFAIAKTDDLSLYSGMTAASEAEARLILQQLLENDPSLTDEIQVVPQYQVA